MDDIYDAPEYALWTAVLETWIIDAKLLGSVTAPKSFYKKNPWDTPEEESKRNYEFACLKGRTLRKSLLTNWSYHICLLSNVDPNWFFDHVCHLIDQSLEKVKQRQINKDPD